MREVQIGLLGLGTVGSGVIEIIRRRQEEWAERYGVLPVVKKALVQSLDKKRNVKIAEELLTTDVQEILQDPEIEVIVEVMGGEEPALSIVSQALCAGKHLITANKLMLALHGPALFKLAEQHRVMIAFEASVGGGIPIIRPLQDSLTANAIQSFMGIVNGTTNYILTAMSQDGAGYYDVLERAQALGYAEADPSSDVDGWDACYKLSVLTGVAYGAQLPTQEIPTTGISQISLAEMELAKELGYTIKLVATGKRKNGQITGHVHPTLLPLDHPLANVHGVNNALFIKGDAVGEVMLYGPGAGMMATGSAVTSDLLRVCRAIAYQDQLTTIGKVSEGAPMPLPQDQAPVFYQSEGATTETNRYIVMVQSVEKPQAGQLGAKLDRTGLPIESVTVKDHDNMYLIGIMTATCTQQKVDKLVEVCRAEPKYRQVNYYYVEGGA